VRTATSLWSIFRGSGSLRNGCATIVILQPSPKPSHSNIRRIWRTGFYNDGYTGCCTNLRIERGDF
jgi:hypothetical protein